MGNKEHEKILKTDLDVWNQWRRNHPYLRPDLSNTDLTRMELYVEPVIRQVPDFSTQTRALQFTVLNLRGANLRGANLTEAHIDSADLTSADLQDANLRDSFLSNNDFSGANLDFCDFSRARFMRNRLGSNDLSTTKGLETVNHHAPSVIGIDTLYLSAGKIPQAFLLGCGVPESFINYIPSLVGAQEAVQFYSCFISYSHKDEDFAKRLHSRMRAEQMRVWFAPEDMKGGRKVSEQIDQAIQVHDRLLLVLSEHSMESEWVKSEIRRARNVEISEKRQKLFPIRLVDFETLRRWKCVDADTGKDLAVEIREYFVPDFSAWTDHPSFELAFDRLLRDLRAAEVD
jgi:hypothetical protein